MTDKFVREWEDEKIKVTLTLTMRDVKSILQVLGRSIKKRQRRLVKKAREGQTFVPKPGHKNIEVLALECYKDADVAVRRYVDVMPREDGRIVQLRPKGWTKEDEAEHIRNLSKKGDDDE